MYLIISRKSINKIKDDDIRKVLMDIIFPSSDEEDALNKMTVEELIHEMLVMEKQLDKDIWERKNKGIHSVIHIKNENPVIYQ